VEGTEKSEADPAQQILDDDMSVFLMMMMLAAAESKLTPHQRKPGSYGYPASVGFPDKPSWGWTKAPPKTSLVVEGTEKSAAPWILNLVQFVHWSPIVPALLMARSVLADAAKWTAYFKGNRERTLLLLLSPIVAFFGGLPGIMMHTYEGWMVAPFKNPLTDLFEVTDVNNQWLREVAYQFIFTMQYVGLQLFSLAVFRDVPLLPMAAVSVLGFLVAYLGNQQHKTTFFLFPNRKPTTYPRSTFPLAVPTVVVFILGAVLNLVAFYDLGTHVPAWGGLKALAPPILIAAGGAIEGLLAETLFNQWIHFGAVVLFNAGFWLELLLLKSPPPL